MKIDGKRLNGDRAHIRLARSRRDEGCLFMSSPFTMQLTRDQVDELVLALQAMTEKLWPRKTDEIIQDEL